MRVHFSVAFRAKSLPGGISIEAACILAQQILFYFYLFSFDLSRHGKRLYSESNKVVGKINDVNIVNFGRMTLWKCVS